MCNKTSSTATMGSTSFDRYDDKLGNTRTQKYNDDNNSIDNIEENYENYLLTNAVIHYKME